MCQTYSSGAMVAPVAAEEGEESSVRKWGGSPVLPCEDSAFTLSEILRF